MTVINNEHAATLKSRWTLAVNARPHVATYIDTFGDDDDMQMGDFFEEQLEIYAFARDRVCEVQALRALCLSSKEGSVQDRAAKASERIKKLEGTLSPKLDLLLKAVITPPTV